VQAVPSPSDSAVVVAADREAEAVGGPSEQYQEEEEGAFRPVTAAEEAMDAQAKAELNRALAEEEKRLKEQEAVLLAAGGGSGADGQDRLMAMSGTVHEGAGFNNLGMSKWVREKNVMWLGEAAVKKLRYLEARLPTVFGGIIQHIEVHHFAWRRWRAECVASRERHQIDIDVVLKPPFGADSKENPTLEKHEDVLTWSCDVTRPQALILLSCMCPEMIADMTRLLLSVYVPNMSSALESESMVDVGALYRFSSPNTAIALFEPTAVDTSLSAGPRVMPLNPMIEIETCARNFGIRTTVISIEAQTKRDNWRWRVMERFKTALSRGDWLVIENCDLHPSIMQELLEAMTKVTIAETWRSPRSLGDDGDENSEARTGFGSRSPSPSPVIGARTPLMFQRSSNDSSPSSSPRGSPVPNMLPNGGMALVGMLPGMGSGSTGTRQGSRLKLGQLVRKQMTADDESKREKAIANISRNFMSVRSHMVKKSEELKNSHVGRRCEHALAIAKGVSAMLGDQSSTAKERVAHPNFRLWLVSRWPDVDVRHPVGGDEARFSSGNTDAGSEKGIRAPCRIPLVSFPGVVGCASTSYSHVSKPLLVSKRSLEIAIALENLGPLSEHERAFWQLLEHTMAAFFAQVELKLHRWDVPSKLGLRELEMAIGEAIYPLRVVALPLFMELHLVISHLQSLPENVGRSEATAVPTAALKDADEVSSAAWRNTIRGIARTFDFMEWQPYENFGGPAPVSLSGLFEIFFCSPNKRASMSSIIEFLEKLPTTGRTAGTWGIEP